MGYGNGYTYSTQKIQLSMLQTHKSKLLFTGCLLTILAVPLLTQALTLNVPIGELTEVPGDNPLGVYFKAWYDFVIATIGIMCTVVIMWAGFRWLTSRGNNATISDCKEQISSALIGLLLAFMSYAMLQLINPELVRIQIPELSSISSDGLEGLSQDSRSYPISSQADQANQDGNTALLNAMGIEVKPGVRVDGLEWGTLGLAGKMRTDGSAFVADGDLDMVITSAYRPGDSGSQHALGRAMDVRRTPEMDAYLDSVISQPGAHVEAVDREWGRIYRTQIGGQSVRIIKEPQCWHIDTKPHS